MALRAVSPFVLLFCVLLCSCGGGGGGDNGGGGGGGTPAPSSLSYPTPPAFQIGQAITSLSPTVTGAVSAYSVSPAVPAGLSLDASTGVLSGTPTALSGTASYTVEASNSSGKTTTTLTLRVNDVSPAISYGAKSFTLTAQVSMRLTPTNTGGAVVTWSISPALPAGLTFDTTNGNIAGTVASAATATTHVVTAQNSGGQSSATLALSAQSVLLDLGNVSGVSSIRLGNSRVLSLDGTRTWHLWDASTRLSLASGPAECVQKPGPFRPCDMPNVDIAGSIIVIERRGALEIRSATNGSLTATVAAPAFTWWRLAADGSYLAGGSETGLTVWSPTGTVIASRSGLYSDASAFAATGALRLARGPAGASVIETISLPSGTSSVGPAFQGTFNSWFDDGARFLTNVGNTVWVYSFDGVQQDLAALPTALNLTGQGSWFWTYQGSSLTVYKVGAGGVPAATFAVGGTGPTPIPSAMTIAAFEDVITAPSVVRILHQIDLSGASPVMVDYTASGSTYAARSSTDWLLGSGSGRLLEGASLGGTLRYFGFGNVSSIAGSSQRVAIATAVGKILYFNAATSALEGTLDSTASQLALSADGTVLVATSLEAVATTEVYSLPAGTLIYTWPAASLRSFALSDSGTALAQVRQGARQVTAPTGGSVIWSDTATGNAPRPLRLSPDGTLLAVSSELTPTTTTNVYRNGALVTAVPGWAVGWLDDFHLLIQNYTNYDGTAYRDSTIYSPSGTKLSSPLSYEFEKNAWAERAVSFQILGPDSIYDRDANKIIAVSTGAATWSTATPATRGLGAVAGPRVIFLSGSQVFSQPF